MGELALIGLGSNLGDRRAILDRAVLALGAADGASLFAVSSFHETAPVGGPGGQGTFLNAALALETTLGPHDLLALLREVEAREGRVRRGRWGERTLDLDLLLLGDREIDAPDLTLPHPRMALRRFVLSPLEEIAPGTVDPITGRTVSELLANLDRRPSCIALYGSGWDRALVADLVQSLDAIEGTGPRGQGGESLPDWAAVDPGGERRMPKFGGNCWVVTDHWDVDLLTPSPLNESVAPRAGRPSSTRRRPTVPQPTFLALRSHEEAGPSPRCGVPILRIPGQFGREAILAEILAACAATRIG